CFQHNSGFTF
nr:immunoglobulin light chain junction region [Macaca mulatta]MOW42387.1 immunoglobulin light chain junction region [Macaca mulatta]MOW45236.1 immunoglobulin light chain junction region [Macaca mulatta]